MCGEGERSPWSAIVANKATVAGFSPRPSEKRRGEYEERDAPPVLIQGPDDLASFFLPELFE